MTADTDHCESCGHPKHCHKYGPAAASGWRCTATVYEFVDRGPGTGGANAWPCPCKHFKRADAETTEP